MDEFAGIWQPDAGAIDPAAVFALHAAFPGQRLRRLAFAANFYAVAAYRRAPDVGDSPLPSGHFAAPTLACAQLTERASLAERLPDLRSAHSDTERVQIAVQHWGIAAAVPHLRGGFAIASWDATRRCLHLARGANGHRTLYLHRAPRRIVFATQLTALLSLPEIPRALDERAIAEFLIGCQDRPQRTLYAEIDRVLAGSLLTITATGTHMRSFAAAAPRPGHLRLRSDRDYLIAAREVLDSAVADAYRNTGPTTLALTGGLDSMAIASSALRQRLTEPIVAATRIPRGPRPTANATAYYSEAQRVGAYAALHPELRWHPLAGDGDGDAISDVDRDAVMRFTRTGVPALMPVDFSWLFPVYRYAAARGSGACLIDGRHGNCYFSDTGNDVLRHLLWPRDWPALLRECTALGRRSGRGPVWHLGGAILRATQPDALQRWRHGGAARLWRQRYALNATLAAQLRLHDSIDPRRYCGQHNIGSPRTEDRRVWGDSPESSHDQFAALRLWTGLEFRHPLGDRRIIEFFGALPYAQLMRNGLPRAMARSLLQGEVPEEIVSSLQRGRQSGDWFTRMSAQHAQLQRRLTQLRSSALARHVLDLDKLQDWLNDWPADVEAAESHRFRLLRGLAGGLEMGAFLQWHEHGGPPANAAPAAIVDALDADPRPLAELR